MRLRIALLAPALAAVLGAGAAQAQAPAYHLAGKPKLYVTTGFPARVYVTFRTREHLHEPRIVVAAVAGHHGRTYASRSRGVANCYRSAVITRSSPGLTPHHIYRVDFLSRPSAHSHTETRVTTFHLGARSFTAARHSPAPSC
jgi:hypothetical protein